MNTSRLTSTIVLILAMVTLAACRSTPPEPDAADFQRAEAMRPADSRLAEKYLRSCITCHTVQGSGAPLAGFAPAWQARLTQGMPTLVLHARAGFQAMPARGACNDCSDEELQQLIAFMATAKDGR